MLDEGWVRTARTLLLQFGLEGLHALGHAFASVFLQLFEHASGSYSTVTAVPTSSPRTMRVRSPGLFRLKTRSGRRLSRHMTMAVASMTFRRSCSTLSKVSCV